MYNYALLTNPFNQIPGGYIPGAQPSPRMAPTSSKNKKSVSSNMTSLEETSFEVESNENVTTKRIVKRQVTPQPYYPAGAQNLGNYNQYGYSGQQVVTILAPTDSALAGLTSLVMGNQSAIDAIISQHVIINSQNVPYYTEHDQNLFQNGQTYGTAAQGFSLTATVQLDPRNNINSKF